MNLTVKRPMALAAAATLAVASTLAMGEPLPIRINVIVHEDVPAALHPRLETDYLQPWVREMEAVTGRRVQLYVNHNVPEVAGLSYRTDDRRPLLSALMAYNSRFWPERTNQVWNYRRDKTLLLVKDSHSPENGGDTLLGEGVIKGSVGWASLTAFATPGHELGHMFGATHEDAQVLFNGWFCETYTYPARNDLRSNCYRYSDANREAIRAYLSEAT